MTAVPINSNKIRKDLKEKYYLKWKPQHDVYKQDESNITSDFLIKMYKEYILN